MVGVAHTARKRDRSEAKTRARWKMLKYMVRLSCVGRWSGSLQPSGAVVSRGIECTSRSRRKKHPFYREDKMQIGEGMF